MMSISPKNPTENTHDDHGYIVQQSALFVFTNRPDLDAFARYFLKWTDEELTQAKFCDISLKNREEAEHILSEFDAGELPRITTFYLMDACKVAEQHARRVLIDYQLEKNKGFYSYEPYSNAWAVMIR